MAQLLEQLNRLDELEELFNKIPAELISRPLIGLVKAKLLRRQSKLEEAQQILDKVQDFPDNHWLSASIEFEYARILDKLGKYDQAWNYAIKANKSTSLIWPKRWQQSDLITKMLKHFPNQSLKQQESSYGEFAPTFIIGFPRSGTTLLDRILDSHSNISVMNEEPIIEKIANQLGGLNYLSTLDRLAQEEIKYFRQEYIELVKKQHPELFNTKVFVDKLPLNIL